MSTLDEITDLLNRRLQEAEAIFVAHGFATTATVALEEGEHGAALTFGKSSNRWGLWIETTDGRDAQSQIVPITSSSRLLRVLAASKLDALWAALEARVEKDLVEVTEAARAVRDFNLSKTTAAEEPEEEPHEP